MLTTAGSQSQIAVNEEIARLLSTDPRVKELSRVTTRPYLWAALFDWGLIAGAAFLSHSFFHPALYVLACLVIAGRQHAFFALSHEGAHYRISKNRRWNDLLSNCLFAYPVLFDTEAYRQNHLKHHSHLNTEQDPDWVRKIQLPQWQFPMQKSYVAGSFANFAFWYGPKEWLLIMLQLGKVLPLRQITQPESLKKVGRRALYYSLLAAPLTYFSLWGVFLAYWAVPLLFVFPTLQRVRSVAEHFGLARENNLNQTRNVLAPWYERLLFGPHNINYHLDHHLIASVPFYNLPRLHEVLKENAVYAQWAHENTSYVVPSARPLARDLFGPPAPQGKGEQYEPENDAGRRAA